MHHWLRGMAPPACLYNYKHAYLTVRLSMTSISTVWSYLITMRRGCGCTCQANPQLGPLQISLGCMLIDIGKFFFIFFLVITSFACGLNQLYYFYSASGALVAPATTVAPHDVTSNRASTGNWSATTTGQQQTTAQQQQEQLQDNDFENAFDPLVYT